MHARIPALLIPLLLAGCAAIPDGVRARTVRSWEPGNSPAECHLLSFEHALRSPRDPATAVLDPTRIRLLIWNVLKGSRAGWGSEFVRYAHEQDLLILQEVALTDGLAATIAHAGMVWDLAIAFEWRHRPTGIMTASRAKPEFVCVQRTLEPFLWLPKTTMISRYPIAGSERKLVVVNIHAVNFTFGTAEFRIQMRQLADILIAHDGPLIVAGDFNTWSRLRMSLVRDILVDRLKLEKVVFETARRSGVFGRPLDHAYYRGLRVVETRTEASETSDHNPLWVEFALEEEPPR